MTKGVEIGKTKYCFHAVYFVMDIVGKSTREVYNDFYV